MHTAQRKQVNAQRLRDILKGTDQHQGVFELAMQHKTTTTAFKGVHLMNDLAQTVLGGVPAHRGDLVARVIREGHQDEANQDAQLRTMGPLGEAYSRAFPESLDPRKLSAVRAAIGQVVNFDGGMYKPRTSMASGLVTHRDLLGAEGFRRYQVGGWLAGLLGEEGALQVRDLFLQSADPYARALAPLCWQQPLEPDKPRSLPPPTTPFELDLSKRLRQLMKQPLSKTTLLRYLLLTATLGLTLRLLGVGRPEGRPAAFATAPTSGQRVARALAVQSQERGVQAFNRYMASLLLAHPLEPELWTRPPILYAGLLVDCCESREETAIRILEAARDFSWPEEGTRQDLYWPETFVVSFARRAGLILPRADRAGWGRHLALTPELLEALVLMYSPAGSPPLPWRAFWRQVAAELGLRIGANEDEDALAFRQAGLVQVNQEHLHENAELALDECVRRGVARRLPDSGAEVGGELL